MVSVLSIFTIPQTSEIPKARPQSPEHPPHTQSLLKSGEG